MTDISAYMRQNKAMLTAEIVPMNYDAIRVTIITARGPIAMGEAWTLQQAFENALAPPLAELPPVE